MADDEIQGAVIRNALNDMANIRGASQDAPEPNARESIGPPSGSSVLWAEWRRGLKDLQNAVLNPFPQGHVAQHEEPGTISNPTQLEVYKNNHEEVTSPEITVGEQSYDFSQHVRPGGGEKDRGRSR